MLASFFVLSSRRCPYQQQMKVFAKCFCMNSCRSDCYKNCSTALVAIRSYRFYTIWTAHILSLKL